MKTFTTDLPEVLLVEPKVFADDRGFFLEIHHARAFSEAVGRRVDFVQDNHSRSSRGVLRGLHYQLVKPQAKLVRCVVGEIFDVAVDIRKGSPHFGKWTGAVLSAENKHQFWVPEGFAHGFLVLSEVAEVLYKTTEYWYPEHDRAIRFDDPDIGIAWPGAIKAQLSAKDAAAPLLAVAEVF